MRDRTKEYAKRKTEEYRAKQRVANMPQETIERTRKRKLRGHYKYKYGLTTEQIDQMRNESNNICAICLKESKLVVDHNHSTGAVRGLLCHNCNVGIGCFADSVESLQRAILYLKG